MRRAGVTLVSVAIFSWSRLEPKDGSFEFDWLDDILRRLERAGIAVDLATGTASPPGWFSHAHPETLPVDREGHRLWPGSRQAWCPSSTVFTRYATRLTAEMATRYHDHPAWPCGTSRTSTAVTTHPATATPAPMRSATGWCTATATSRPSTSWGTAFWSQRYVDWEHILPPRHTPTFSNPTQVLDYRRFQSDALLSQYVAERDVLHRLSPGVPVTTNFMTLTDFRRLDYHRWAPEQDVVSTDHYRVTRHQDVAAELSFCGDLTSGLAGGRPWMLMEHSTSAVNWQPVNPAKGAGQLVRDSLTHVAHGADTIGFFQWRASRVGSEKYHSAMLHTREPTPRCSARYAGWARSRPASASSWEAPCRRTSPCCGTTRWPGRWRVPPSPRPGSTTPTAPSRCTARCAASAWRRTSRTRVPTSRHTGSSWCQPSSSSVTSTRRRSRPRRAGAHVLVTYLSGIVDEHDHVRLGGYPGAFRELLGARVEEFRPLLEGRAGPSTTPAGRCCGPRTSTRPRPRR